MPPGLFTLQYGTFANLEVTCAAERDVPTPAWMNVLTFIHGELCLRIPLFYFQQFSATFRLTDASFEEGTASLESVRGLRGPKHRVKTISSFYAQVDTRWNSFVERCRQGWLGIHVFSTLTAGQVLRNRYFSIIDDY